jgi:hypothetical protein
MHNTLYVIGVDGGQFDAIEVTAKSALLHAMDLMEMGFRVHITVISASHDCWEAANAFEDEGNVINRRIIKDLRVRGYTVEFTTAQVLTRKLLEA